MPALKTIHSVKYGRQKQVSYKAGVKGQKTVQGRVVTGKKVANTEQEGRGGDA